MLPHKYLPSYTIEDYNRWEGEWELIDGIPYAMSPSPVRKHQQLAKILLLQASKSLDSNKANCGNCEVLYELDWILANNTIVRPDISITCEQGGDFLTEPPILIVEIISPSTALKDRHLKFDIYEKEGVRYYLVIDPNTKAKQIFELTDGHYQEKDNITSFTIHDNCSVQLDLETALAELGET